MCGIAGFTQFTSSPGDKATLKEMGDTIAHRGPDAHGEYIDEHVGLAHRRLSIIDLSEAGNQPMFSSCGNYVVVFNGEVYNFLTLRKELEAEGVQFQTKTDTEVILALYQKMGSEFVTRIHGMFAIALWDKQRKKLILARDRLGKKPLYYYKKDNDFIFASELKAILAIESVPREVNAEAVYDFFMYQYIPEPKSIFANIFKLEAGHYLEISADGAENKQYWDVSFADVKNANEEQIKGELYDLISDCVEERMIADVPLGAFLSGGVDSSGVVGMMALSSDKPVTTCSIGFDSKKFDETKFAKIIADQYKTNHHELVVKEDTTAKLEEIAAYFDEPFADSSQVPTYFVSQLARQKVTVALAGDGGDENFAGYSKYGVDHIENTLRNKFPQTLRRHVFPPLADLLGNMPGRIARKGNTLLDTLARSPGYGFYLTNTFFTQSLWDDLALNTTKTAVGEYHPSSVMLNFYNKADSDDHLSKILYTDIKTYLVGDILVKVDRMSMANSLEVRAPILDHKVVEYAAQIPSTLKYNRGEKKYILKEAFKKILPHDTLYRKKMGFAVPLAQWLRNEVKALAEEKLFSRNSGISNYFNVDALRRVWEQHQSGEKDYASPLWSFLMFELWWQNYMAGKS